MSSAERDGNAETGSLHWRGGRVPSVELLEEETVERQFERDDLPA